MNTQTRRRPVEAIKMRTQRSAECEQRVREALTKIIKSGLPFTVEELCQRAGVGKTFIYDKRHPELTRTVLEARDASQIAAARRHEEDEREVQAQAASWRDRALNAEALIVKLRSNLRERDARINDLTGQLFDPEGVHLADENTRLRKLVDTLNQQLSTSRSDVSSAQRSLHASRVTVRRERERNLALIQPPIQRFDALEPPG